MSSWVLKWSRPSAAMALVFAVVSLPVVSLPFLSGWIPIDLVTSAITLAAGQRWAIYLSWIGAKIVTIAFAYCFSTVLVRRRPLPVHLLILVFSPLSSWYPYAVLVEPATLDIVRLFRLEYTCVGLAMEVCALPWPFVTEAPREQRRFWPVVLCKVKRGTLVGAW